MRDPACYDWLPDRHLGVVATLAHADEIIEQIGDLLFAYGTQAGGPLCLKEVADGPVGRSVVLGIAPLPRKVPLLVADALVTLRGALEHTLFTEAEFLNDGSLSKTASRNVAMPSAKTYSQFSKWTDKQRRNGGPSSLRVGGELNRRVEALQPLHRTVDPDDHPLDRLTSYTNHFKHRTPAVTAVRLAAMYRDRDQPRSIRDVEHRPEVPIRIGDVIAESPIGQQEVFTLFPTVGVNLPGTDRWPVLMRELGGIGDWVRRQAIPRLVTGSSAEGDPLPARYDISFPHNDERAAIVSGRMESAGKLAALRLQAEGIRQDMPALLCRTDRELRGSDADLRAEEVALWAAQVPDKGILDRWSTFGRGDDSDPEAILLRWDVLCALRDEAAEFASRPPGES